MVCSVPELAAPEPDDSSGTRLAWEAWQCLDLLADTGEVDSLDRQAWEILVRVHGFPAVLRAAARCYWLVAPKGRVTSEQAQNVLAGRDQQRPAIRRIPIR